jgi:Carboxypeptidase regulatory-like domain
MRHRRIRSAILVLVGIALSPGLAFAQSAIAGVVKDSSGAVLPGVTVEAASPALIEGVRTATTDGQGQYKIINLRPGTYSVTFTLPGFNTVKRDSIELPANFTAPVNAAMRVGAIEETVNVAAQSPVVDVQSIAQQQVLPKQLLDAVPTGGRNIQSVGTLMAGVQKSGPDVGGAAGMQQRYIIAHGADPKDDAIEVDGMSVKGIEGDGAIQNYFNEGMFQEFSYQTGAISAESSNGGVLLNMIPKEGGNTFTADLFYSGTGSSLQANNVSQDLIDRGLKAGDSVDSIHDLNLGAGGPVRKDKLWFYTSFRHWGVNQKVANAFENSDPTHDTYAPDFSKQVVDNNHIRSHELRLTWQATPKHKFGAYLDRIFKYRFHEGAANYTEEAFSIRDPSHGIYYTGQAKYTGTLSSKLLAEFGWSSNNETYTTSELEPSTQGTAAIPRQDIILGTYWGAAPSPFFLHEPVQRNWSGSLSYVTGSHAIKTGVQWGYGFNRSQRSFQQPDPNNPALGIDLVQRYRNGVPDSVTVYNTPVESKEDINADLGVYAQDNWTMKRVTVTGGVRFEHFNTSIAAAAVGAGRFVPARSFPEVKNYPNWNDVTPRLGFSWDLFGDGTTAVKSSWGRYMVAFSTVGFAQIYDPLFLSSDTRTWTDLNGDNIAQDNEIGPSQNKSFGVKPERSPDPNIKRPYNNEFTASIQRQLVPGVAMTFGYYHRDYHRLFYSDNLALSPSDWTPIQITNPLDGSPLTVYSLARDKVGAIDIVDKNSDTNSRVYNGFELSFNARLPHGANAFGGLTTDRTVANNCQPYVGANIYHTTLGTTAASNPNAEIYCDQTQLSIPFRTQFKLSGNYPMPYGVELSGTFQSYPGFQNYGSGAGGSAAAPWLDVQYKISPKVVPGLNQSAETVPLIAPGTKYLDRLNQLDVRLAKKFPLGSGNWQLQLDIFNVLNASTAVATNQTFGSSLDQPTQILLGRLLSIGAQFHF